MALPFQDAFSGSENPLADHYTTVPNDGTYFLDKGFKEDGTAAVAAATNENIGSYVDDETFDADQYGEFTLLHTAIYNIGVIFRYDTASNDCYLAHIRPSGRVYVHYYDHSVPSTTSIGPASYETVSAIADNSRVRFEIAGVNPGIVTVYDDTVQLGDDVWDDSTLDDGGKVGLYAYSVNTSTQLLDDFEAGDLGGAPPQGLSIPIAMYHYMHH